MDFVTHYAETHGLTHETAQGWINFLTGWTSNVTARNAFAEFCKRRGDAYSAVCLDKELDSSSFVRWRSAADTMWTLPLQLDTECDALGALFEEFNRTE